MFIYIIIVVLLISVIIFKIIKSKKSHVNIDIMPLALNISIKLSGSINRFINKVAENNCINVRDIYEIRCEDPVSCVDKLKAFQASVWIRSFFFTKTMLTIARMDILSKDQFRLLFSGLKDIQKETLPDYDNITKAMFVVNGLGEVSSDLEYEYDGFIEDIVENDYSDKVLSELLKHKIEDYLGLESEKIKDFDEIYTHVLSDLHSLASETFA